MRRESHPCYNVKKYVKKVNDKILHNVKCTPWRLKYFLKSKAVMTWTVCFDMWWCQTVSYDTKKVHHHFKEYNITSKSMSCASKFHHDIKIKSWRQNMQDAKVTLLHQRYVKKIVMTSKVRHDVNKYIKTSKLHNVVKNTSWRQQVHDVKCTLWRLKGIMRSN